MGYHKQDGRFADTEDVTLLAAAAHDATVTGPWIELGDRNTLRLVLEVTAASGTLDVAVETSRTGAASDKVAVGSFTQAAAEGVERKCMAGIDRFVRAVGTISGGGAFTFSLAGEAS